MRAKKEMLLVDETKHRGCAAKRACPPLLKGVARKGTALLAAVALVLGLCSCSGDEGSQAASSASAHLVIGVAQGEYASVVDAAADSLAERGITYELVEYEDRTAALDALSQGEVDVAFCTDLPHVSAYNQENDASLTSKGAVTSSRMALYSASAASLDDLPEGAMIALPADDLDCSRALYLLADAGLVELSDDADALAAGLDDIEENPRGFVLTQVDEADLAASLDSADAAAIPFAFAHEAGLDFAAALAAEGDSSDAAWEYADVVAVRSDDEAIDKLDKLVASMRAPEIEDGLESLFGDAVYALLEATWGNM